MNQLMNQFAKYAWITTTYGVIRKPFVLKDAKIGEYVSDDKGKPELIERDMLIAEKVSLTVFGGLLNVYFWPVFLYKDISNLEKKARGMDPRLIGPHKRMNSYRPNDLYDYIWE